MTGDRLRELRTAAAWSRARLAQELRMSAETVWRWESGAYPIPASRVAHLDAVLGARIAEIGRKSAGVEA